MGRPKLPFFIFTAKLWYWFTFAVHIFFLLALVSSRNDVYFVVPYYRYQGSRCQMDEPKSFYQYIRSPFLSLHLRLPLVYSANILMACNKLTRITKHPARADKSAVGAINRPLQVSG